MAAMFSFGIGADIQKQLTAIELVRCMGSLLDEAGKIGCQLTEIVDEDGTYWYCVSNAEHYRILSDHMRNLLIDLGFDAEGNR